MSQRSSPHNRTPQRPARSAMSSSRGRRSRDSRREPERRKSSIKITNDQKRFLRKLLHVLAKVVDEKDKIGDVESDSDSDSEPEDEKTKNDEDTTTRNRPHPPRDQRPKDIEKELLDEKKTSFRLRKLCENHGKLTYQIQSSLKALGGSGRTAKALEKMSEEISKIHQKEKVFVEYDKTECLKSNLCASIFRSANEAGSEVMQALKELGVFNKNFFDTLEKLREQFLLTAIKLEVEYGACPTVPRVNSYMNSLFEPLNSDLDAYIQSLTTMAEREIATIRQSQDFSSQRYLNLTTVATFLSSVTVSTLQITADDSGSSLSAVANTFWFISLVFSTASAVYSLQVMTWRQSSVRPPDRSLPSFLDLILRNGAMYALVAALMTFSVGLCLLAFRVAKQQEGIASAIVPTAFAGMHAYVIFLFAAWFLFEQWKARHEDIWTKAKDEYIIPVVTAVKEKAIKIKDHGLRAKVQLIESSKSFMARRRKPVSFAALGEKDRDVESARGSVVVQIIPDNLPAKSESLVLDEKVEGVEPEMTLAIPEGITSSTGNDSKAIIPANGDKVMSEDTFKPFENVLQFSPDGRLLASACADSVTIYDVTDSFTVRGTISLPDGGCAKQITWRPVSDNSEDDDDDDKEPEGDLLVRSDRGVSVWNIKGSESCLTSQMAVTTESVRWTNADDSGFNGFACTIGITVKIFDEKCQELWSFDVPTASDRIFDMTFLLNKYVLCIANLPNSSYNSLLVVNRVDKAVESVHELYSGNQSMVVSASPGDVLFYGSEKGVQLVTLRFSDAGIDFDLNEHRDYKLWECTRHDEEMITPEQAVVLHSENDRMIIGYAGGEIVTLYRKPGDGARSALHIFTTPTLEAVLEKPMSFAVNRGASQEPYMFAFGDEHGSVIIWSVQSNRQLLNLALAKDFEVRDRREGRTKDPTLVMGQFLTLPSPEV